MGVWGRVVWSVCFVTRVGCLSLYAPREQALGWAKGRELGHTGLSFLDVAPPRGAHCTRWWPALRDGAGYVREHQGWPVSSVPALPTLQIGGVNRGGALFFPNIPVEPWAFLFFFPKSRPFWTLHFFL